MHAKEKGAPLRRSASAVVVRHLRQTMLNCTEHNFFSCNKRLYGLLLQLCSKHSCLSHLEKLCILGCLLRPRHQHSVPHNGPPRIACQTKKPYGNHTSLTPVETNLTMYLMCTANHQQMSLQVGVCYKTHHVHKLKQGRHHTHGSLPGYLHRACLATAVLQTNLLHKATPHSACY